MGSGGFRRLFRKDSTTEDEIKQLVDEDKGELENPLVTLFIMF